MFLELSQQLLLLVFGSLKLFIFIKIRMKGLYLLFCLLFRRLEDCLWFISKVLSLFFFPFPFLTLFSHPFLPFKTAVLEGEPPSIWIGILISAFEQFIIICQILYYRWTNPRPVFEEVEDKEVEKLIDGRKE